MKNLIENINNSQIRAKKEEFIKELFNKEDTTMATNINRNRIITDLILVDNQRVKEDKILNLYKNRINIQDIHFLSDEIILIEEYDKYDDANYFRPIVNGKMINMSFNTFDKALIGVLAYKYGAEDFGYKAITAMLGIED